MGYLSFREGISEETLANPSKLTIDCDRQTHLKKVSFHQVLGDFLATNIMT